MNCPVCTSPENWKSGVRYVGEQQIQRYLCKTCGYRFSESSKNGTVQSGNRQICVTLTEGAKNLTAEQKTKVLQENKTKSTLINYSWFLKVNGKAEPTVETYTKLLKTLDKHGELNDPESVKSVIAFHFKDNSTRNLAVCAYDAYIKHVGGTWTKPKYKREHKQVFIPTEQELQTAINSGSKESVTYSLFLYETGARDNEAQRLEWTDLDIERLNVTVKASKNGDSRILPISQNLMDLLFSLPKDKGTVFKKTLKEQ